LKIRACLAERHHHSTNAVRVCVPPVDFADAGRSGGELAEMQSLWPAVVDLAATSVAQFACD